MTICAKPRHNPVVMMRILVEGCLRIITNPTYECEQSVREMYFNQIYRLISNIKYQARFDEYEDIITVFDRVRPQSVDRDVFVEFMESACRRYVDPQGVIDDNSQTLFVDFLRSFSLSLREIQDTCRTFE